MMDLSLLIIRVVFGLLIIGHGTQKLLGWLGGPGLHKASGFVGSRGFAPAKFWTAAGSLSESVGGLLFLLGFLSPLGSIAIALSMLTAIVAFHWPKFWAAEGGYELALAVLTAAVAVWLAGPGAYALDAVLGTALPPAVAWMIAGLTAIAFLAGVIGAARRRRPVAAVPGERAAA